MWTSEKYWYLKLLHHFSSGMAGMVRGIIHHNYRISSPAWPLLVELITECREEDFYDAAVGVGLHQAEVDLAKRVNASDHRNPWHQLELWN